MPLLAEGLRELLEPAEDVHVVWSGAEGDDASRHLDDNCAELVVIGIGSQLPSSVRRLLDSGEIGGNGAHARLPVICVIPGDAKSADILIDYGNRITVMSADATPEELQDAVHEIRDGRPHISVNHAAPAKRSGEPSSAVTFTGRERDVLRLLALGLSTIEMAQRLGVSSNTVRTHVRHLTRKLGVHNRLQATAMASARGLL
jgi:DNA-binding NarL/FixJ family response regulator